MWRVSRTVTTEFSHLCDTKEKAEIVSSFDTPTFIAFEGIWEESIGDYKFEKDGPDRIEEVK